MFLRLVILLCWQLQLCRSCCGNNTFYIIPSVSNNDSIASCPTERSKCFTLSQFFATSLTGSSLTLNLLPGIHALETTCSFLDNFTSIIVKSSSTERETSVICSTSSQLLITNATLVSIQDISISGCNDIDMDFINFFILKNTVLNHSTMHLSNVEAHIEGGNFANGGGIRTGSGSGLGGAILVMNSPILITNSTFSNNAAERGGAIYVQRSELVLDDCQFHKNYARFDGGAVYLSKSNMHISKSTFISNTVQVGHAPETYGLGGALFVTESNTSLYEGNVFMNSKADVGGVIFALVHLSSSTTGVFDINEHCSVYIKENYFVNNRVLYEGSMMFSYGCSDIFDYGSTFENNEINTSQPLDGTYGGVISSTYAFITLNGSVFIGNSAIYRASSLTMINSEASCYDVEISDNWSHFAGANSITEGMIISRSDVNFFGKTHFRNNSGTMYVYNSNVTFSGETTITNCTQLSGPEFGGSISTDQSMLKFYGRAFLTGNNAINGGAINARESQLYFFGEVLLSGNSAEQAGGAIFLLQSELTFQNNCTIVNNSAIETGGGLHAIRSFLRAAVKLSSFHFFNPHLVPEISLTFAENVAKRGGGLSLQSNSKLYVTLIDISRNSSLVNFIDNFATQQFT